MFIKIFCANSIKSNLLHSAPIILYKYSKSCFKYVCVSSGLPCTYYSQICSTHLRFQTTHFVLEYITKQRLTLFLPIIYSDFSL